MKSPLQKLSTKLGHKRLTTTNDTATRNALVVANRRMVYWVCNKPSLAHAVRKLGREEAESAGMLGLIRAAELFDASKGFQFTTYAHQWIWQHVQRACQIHDKLTLRRRERFFSELENRRHNPNEDQPIEGRWAGNAVDAGLQAEQHELLSEALRVLPKTWRRVVVMRFLEGKILADVGRTLNISRERVRQIQDKALARMAEVLGVNDGEYLERWWQGQNCRATGQREYERMLRESGSSEAGVMLRRAWLAWEWMQPTNR